MLNLAEMPKYEKYKETGFHWIGEVPESWAITKLGACLKPFTKKNEPELPLLSITREKGVIVRDVEDEDSNHNFIPDDLSGYKVLNRGQFGMNKMKAWQGSYGVSDHTGIVSPAYFVFDFTKSIDTRFFNWAIRSKLYVSYFGSASDGVRIGQWDLSKARMKAIPFIRPSEVEQTRIANFLDQKTTQIDDAIAIKERQIALLKERKQIIIQKAVTQGLDPSVPMKDSGVDWIGEIPAHWEVIKLKHLFNEKTRRTKTGIETLFSLRMELGLVPHNDVSDKPIPDEDLVDYKIVESGQLVMNRMRASIGIFGLASDFGLVSPDYAVFDVARSVKAEYYLALFKMPLMWTQFRLASKGMGTGSSGFMRLYTDEFGDIKVANPPIQEQEELMRFIEEVTASTASGIDHIQSQIEKLKEYKTTLINCAVTGKIKVTPEMAGMEAEGCLQ